MLATGACQHGEVPVSAAPYQYRPLTGRIVTVGITVVSVIALVGIVAQYGMREGAIVLPWLALVVLTCWACLWRPYVAVDDAGVRFVNVLRTIVLPWPSIRSVDTKWALSLDTAYGTYTAFAAPAPGVFGTARAQRSEASGLPKSTYGPEGIRPGDLPSSGSGETALLIRERLESLYEAGHLGPDSPVEQDHAPIEWHVGTIAIGIALIVASLVTLTL